MHLRGSVLGKQPASGCRVPVNWLAGAVPAGSLWECSHLTVPPSPLLNVAEDVVQIEFSQEKEA